MDNQDSGLKEARSLLIKRKYSNVINQLSSQIFMYRNNPEFYWLLGLACFYTKDWGGAFSYLKRGEDIAQNDIRFKEALAIIYLRRREDQNALLTWLEILELEPNHKRAQQGLDLLKTKEDGDWPYELDQGKLEHLYPTIPKQTKLPIITALSILAILTVGLIGILILPPTDPGTMRSGMELLLAADEISDPSDYSEFAEIILTDSEMDLLKNEIKDDFNNGRDNRVRYNMNRLLRSNAPLELKESYSQVLSSLQEPNLSQDFFNPSFISVLEDIYNFNNVFIKLSGLAANVVNDDNSGSLNLLVGYETQEVLLGELFVQVPFYFEIAGGQALEVLGRIKLLNDGFMLVATSMRRIMP